MFRKTLNAIGYKIRIIAILQISFFYTLNAQKLSLEAIYKYPLFIPDIVEGINSLNDGIHYTRLINGSEIVKYNYEHGEKVEVLFTLDTTCHKKISEISEYTINRNENKILIAGEKQEIYRYSYLTDYYVYNLIDSSLIPVFTGEKQQSASLSPDGNYVAFVYKNDLYIRDFISDTLVRVTTDGLKNQIINGSPDWLYEEEFTLLTGFYWSDDSRKIAYYRFDESPVKEYNITLYDSLYPSAFSYKYPSAGEANSQVDIYVYHLLSGKHVKMIADRDSDMYIPRIKWLPTSDDICITSLNRRQNAVDLLLCNAETGISRSLYSEVNDRFLSEFSDDFVSFIDSGKQAIILSEKSGYMHMYRYNVDGSFVNQVTSGNWEVDEILGIDDYTQRIFYTSTEVSPLERQIYSIRFDGTEKTKITAQHGVHTAEFSKTFKYYILTSSDANTPFKVGLYNIQNELIRMLEENLFVSTLIKEFNFSEKKFFRFQNKTGDTLNAYYILPPNFRKNKKYPVLIYVYGGPESQFVMDQWEKSLAWFQLLAQHGYIIACADNRGTDGRGESFKKCIYLQLGNLETEDQIALAEYLKSQPYVDRNRIGIFGWSYGGYMSLLCLMKGNNIFKTAVAVAPVTDWRYYDSAYTERYMGTPRENAYGYDQSSLLMYVEQLQGKLLLIHGTGDDNVHIQNSMMLVKKMIEADKQFEVQFYPDQDHSISDGNSTYHLFKRATDFIFNSL